MFDCIILSQLYVNMYSPTLKSRFPLIRSYMKTQQTFNNLHLMMYNVIHSDTPCPSGDLKLFKWAHPKIFWDAQESYYFQHNLVAWSTFLQVVRFNKNELNYFFFLSPFQLTKNGTCIFFNDRRKYTVVSISSPLIWQ